MSQDTSEFACDTSLTKEQREVLRTFRFSPSVASHESFRAKVDFSFGSSSICTPEVNNNSNVEETTEYFTPLNCRRGGDHCGHPATVDEATQFPSTTATPEPFHPPKRLSIARRIDQARKSRLSLQEPEEESTCCWTSTSFSNDISSSSRPSSETRSVDTPNTFTGFSPASSSTPSSPSPSPARTAGSKRSRKSCVLGTLRVNLRKSICRNPISRPEKSRIPLPLRGRGGVPGLPKPSSNGKGPASGSKIPKRQAVRVEDLQETCHVTAAEDTSSMRQFQSSGFAPYKWLQPAYATPENRKPFIRTTCTDKSKWVVTSVKPFLMKRKSQVFSKSSSSMKPNSSNFN